MSFDLIKTWHERACPAPDQRAFDVQLGCHLEEVAEQLETFEVSGVDHRRMAAIRALSQLAFALKTGESTATITKRDEFLDAACDQIVTSIGAAHRAGMNVCRAIRRVDASNWSKFDELGQPLFDENGKVRKGPAYKKPNLTGLY